MTAPLWQPSRERVLASNLTAFARAAQPEAGHPLSDYAALYRFSIEQPERFWRLLWRFAGIAGRGRGRARCCEHARAHARRALVSGGAAQLRREPPAPARRGARADRLGGRPRPRREISHAELAADVSRLAQALAAWGVGPGDRVAGFLPNLPEAVVAMLAAASLGAIWSSCSPDFGTRGVVDRFGQITPKVLFAADGYGYAGKRFDSLARVAEIRREIDSLERVVIVPSRRASRTSRRSPAPCSGTTRSRASPRASPASRASRSIIRSTCSTPPAPPARRNAFCTAPAARCSSTAKEHLPARRPEAGRQALLLHDHRLDDVELAGVGTRVRTRRSCSTTARRSIRTRALLFDLAERERVAVFGTSAKFIDAAAKAGIEPVKTHDLSPLRTRALDRLAARARGLRLGLRAREARRPLVVDLGGHRHHRLLRRRQPDRAGLARRDPGALPRHAGGGLRRAGAQPARREGRARLHGALPVRSARLLERSRTAGASAPPTSRSTPASGATAISRSSRPTTASSSTAAPTPC